MNSRIYKSLSQKLKRIRLILTDLHDPSGIYFQQAWKTCFAAILAALFLYIFPTIGHPVLVITAMVFMHTAEGLNPVRKQLAMISAAVVVCLGVGLLCLVSTLFILKVLLIISFSFCAQYLVKFGAEFSSGSFVWILIVIAIAANPTIAQLPILFLNIGLGLLIAFGCYFWLYPSNPHQAINQMASRTQLRLVALLHQIVGQHEPQTVQQKQLIVELKGRIASLIRAQKVSLSQVRANPALAAATSHDEQLISAQEENLEALIWLEHALLDLQCPAIVRPEVECCFLALADPICDRGDQGRMFYQQIVSPVPAKLMDALHREIESQNLSTIEQAHLYNLSLAIQNVAEKASNLLTLSTSLPTRNSPANHHDSKSTSVEV